MTGLDGRGGATAAGDTLLMVSSVEVLDGWVGRVLLFTFIIYYVTFIETEWNGWTHRWKMTFGFAQRGI